MRGWLVDSMRFATCSSFLVLDIFVNDCDHSWQDFLDILDPEDYFAYVKISKDFKVQLVWLYQAMVDTSCIKQARLREMQQIGWMIYNIL